MLQSSPPPAKVNKPALSGCLVALAIVFIVGVIALLFAWRSISSVVEEAGKDIEKDMVASEEKLRSQPVAETLSLAELLAAFKADKAAATAKFNGKVLELNGFVNNTDVAKSLPIKLPADFMGIQAAPEPPSSTDDLLLCLYSKAQKTRFVTPKLKDPIKVRGKFEVDEDGDYSLDPCLVNP